MSYEFDVRGDELKEVKEDGVKVNNFNYGTNIKYSRLSSDTDGEFEVNYEFIFRKRNNRFYR